MRAGARANGLASRRAERARPVLAAAVGIPLVLGLAAFAAVRGGLLPPGGAIAALALATALSCGAVVRWGADGTAGADGQQGTTERALEASQRRHASILDAALDCIITIDQSGAIVDFNPAAERCFGFSRDEVMGRPLAETIVPPELRDRHRAGLERYLATGEARVLNHRLEMPALRADGSRVSMELAITAFEVGGRTFFTAYLRDNTQRKAARKEIRSLYEHLDQRVRERTEELEALNRELEAFSYSVSHDLRAPLRAIDGFSRILEDDYAEVLDPEGRRLLGVVRSSTQEMGKLIDDLLVFSRLARDPLSRRTVEPAAIVRDVLAGLAGEIDERGVEVAVGDLPPCHADPALLRSVFTNLLSNAVKYTRGREGARIEVGSEEADGGSVYFVRDNGIGFDPRYADKLFGVFQRLHSSDEFEGTGVGLAIVQRVVSRHGGRVWAEGEPERGATFYVQLGEEEGHG